MRPTLSGGGVAAPERKRLPDSLPPRGLSRTEAAAYVGVSPTTFDRLVDDHLMPKPKRIYSRTVWDRKKLDAAFDALDSGSDDNDPWARMSL